MLLGSIFMFSNFYRLDLHNRTHSALASPETGLKSDFPLFSNGYWKFMCVGFLTGHKSPPDYVHY